MKVLFTWLGIAHLGSCAMVLMQHTILLLTSSTKIESLNQSVARLEIAKHFRDNRDIAVDHSQQADCCTQCSLSPCKHSTAFLLCMRSLHCNAYICTCTSTPSLQWASQDLLVYWQTWFNSQPYSIYNFRKYVHRCATAMGMLISFLPASRWGEALTWIVQADIASLHAAVQGNYHWVWMHLCCVTSSALPSTVWRPVHCLQQCDVQCINDTILSSTVHFQKLTDKAFD